MRANVLTALTAVAFFNPLFAQSVTSEIKGTVSDPQGAAVPSARVEIRDADTNATFRATTSERGGFAVPSLPTAVYRVTIAASGFQTMVVEGVKLEPGKPATVNVTLSSAI